MYPNQKTWVNKEVRLLLKAEGHQEDEAQLQSEEHFVSSDSQHMWMGIQAMSDYKPSNSTQTAMDLSFLNALNDFYARFVNDNKEKETLAPDDSISGRVL